MKHFETNFSRHLFYFLTVLSTLFNPNMALIQQLQAQGGLQSAYTSPALNGSSAYSNSSTTLSSNQMPTPSGNQLPNNQTFGIYNQQSSGGGVATWKNPGQFVWECACNVLRKIFHNISSQTLTKSNLIAHPNFLSYSSILIHSSKHHASNLPQAWRTATCSSSTSRRS